MNYIGICTIILLATPSPALNATIQGRKPMAVIDNVIMEEGQQHGPIKLLKVHLHSVLVSINGNLHTLAFRSGIKRVKAKPKPFRLVPDRSRPFRLVPTQEE